MVSDPAAAGIHHRIFVVGVPRSGTTLLQSLLAAHDELTSFTESHLFARHFALLPGAAGALLVRDPGPRLAEFLAENGVEPPPAAAELLARRWAGRRRALLPLATGETARRLLAVLDQVAARRGARGWVEKTPRHLRYLPFLERVAGSGSRPSFVHLVRDGLATAASLHRASRHWQRAYTLEECARRWNADVAISLRRVGSPSDRFVLYEELTARPEATLKRLLAELGLDWQPRILARYAEAADSLVTGEEVAWKGGVGRAIRPAAGAEGLTGDQRRRLERRLRGGLYERLRERLGRRRGGADG